MNERIKQLESRAWGQVNRTNGLVRTEDFNQKFAELIIQECASAVNSRDDSDTGFWADVIKKHFGVEE